MTVSKSNFSKLPDPLFKKIHEFAPPEKMRQISKSIHDRVSLLLSEGYSQQQWLQPYVMRAGDGARQVIAEVLRDATGETDGRGAILPHDTLHPRGLNRLAERAARSLLVFTRTVLEGEYGDKIISFCNNTLQEADTDSPEKAVEVRSWWFENHQRIKNGWRIRIEGGAGPQITLIPPEISCLSHRLSTFGIANHTLSFLPLCLFRMSAITRLVFYKTKFPYLPEEVGDLTTLHQLHVKEAGLTSLPLSLSRLSALQELDISSNPFGQIPRALLQSKNRVVREALEELPDSAFAPIPPWYERAWNGACQCCKQVSLYVTETLLDWLTRFRQWLSPSADA